MFVGRKSRSPSPNNHNNRRSPPLTAHQIALLQQSKRFSSDEEDCSDDDQHMLPTAISAPNKPSSPYHSRQSSRHSSRHASNESLNNPSSPTRTKSPLDELNHDTTAPNDNNITLDAIEGSPTTAPPAQQADGGLNTEPKEGEGCVLDANLPVRHGDYELFPHLRLGRGAFSTVFKARNNVTKEEVAVKAVRVTAETAATIQNELKINRIATGHSCVVSFLTHFHLKDTAFLVFDLCERGEVFHQIVPHSGLAQRECIGPFFAQLVEAVVHLHSKGICHLDIKPENMLIDRHGCVKLGDFGLSTLVADGPVTGCRGSLSYAAPENLRQHVMGNPSISRFVSGYDGQKADVWSCGVVLFVLLYGYTPWEIARESSLEFRMYKATDGYPNMKPWNRMSSPFRSMFHRTLAIRHQRRWTAVALKHFLQHDMGWQPDLQLVHGSRS
eukprot:m.53634 g.53634  ORF g.53634 m.53634 type:complete len:442 (-) comp18421_c0_seq1:168-1493(-)